MYVLHSVLTVFYNPNTNVRVVQRESFSDLFTVALFLFCPRNNTYVKFQLDRYLEVTQNVAL